MTLIFANKCNAFFVLDKTVSGIFTIFSFQSGTSLNFVAKLKKLVRAPQDSLLVSHITFPFFCTFSLNIPNKIGSVGPTRGFVIIGFHCMYIQEEIDERNKIKRNATVTITINSRINMQCKRKRECGIGFFLCLRGRNS